MKFIRRHGAYILLGIFGLLVAYGLYAFVGDMFQIGLNPVEFAIKIFAKLVYVGASVMLTHFVIKHFFTTIYRYCRTEGGKHSSEFMRDWYAYSPEKPFSKKLYIAVAVHIGVYASVCLLLSLAF